MLEGLEQQARSPGVVHQGQDAAFARQGGDGRDVLHFEGQRAGGFQNDKAGFVLDEGDHLFCRQGLREITHAHAEPAQHAVAEQPRGAIDVLADQDVVPGLEQGQHGTGHRRQPRGVEPRAHRPLHLGDGLAKGVAHRKPGAAVGHLVGVVERRRIGQQHG